MEKDTEDYIRQLEKRLVMLEGRVAMLEAQIISMKPVPTYPFPYPSPPWISTAESDAKPEWPGLSTKVTMKLEDHLKNVNLKAYSPISRGDIDL